MTTKRIDKVNGLLALNLAWYPCDDVLDI